MKFDKSRFKIKNHNIFKRINDEDRYRIYGNLNTRKKLFDYWKENQNVDITLLDLFGIDPIVFCYFLTNAFEYIRLQSRYWHRYDEYNDFSNKDIDDSAVSALEVIPDFIKGFNFNDKCRKDIVNFSSWFLRNSKKFDKEIFANFDLLRKEFSEIKEKK